MTDIAQTLEAIAWNLYKEVCLAEKKQAGKDREYIFSTFSQCLKVAKGNYDKKSFFDAVEPQPKVRHL